MYRDVFQQGKADTLVVMRTSASRILGRIRTLVKHSYRFY